MESYKDIRDIIAINLILCYHEISHYDIKMIIRKGNGKEHRIGHGHGKGNGNGTEWLKQICEKSHIKVPYEYALQYSIKKGLLDIVKILYNKGIVLNKYISILTSAVKRGHLAMVKYLVEEGCTHKRDEINALKMAINESKNLEMIEYLIYNLDIDVKKHINIIGSSINIEIVKCLIKTTYLIEEDHSPLYDKILLSISYKRLDIIKFLIEHYSIKSENFPKLKDIIIETISEGYIDIMKYFVEWIEDISPFVRDMFVCSIFYGRLEMLKYILSLGINTSQDYDYALKFSCLEGNLEIVKYLVSIGVDIYSMGDLVLKIAHLKKHINIINYLITLGIR